MNANVNIMATSSNASAAPVKSTQAPVKETARASSSDSDTKDNSFSNVLDKTQQDKAPQDKPDTKENDAAADVAKDPISQAIAAAVQQNAAKQPQEPQKEAAGTTEAASLAAKVLTDAQGKALQNTLQGATTADALPTGAAQALAEALTETTPGKAVDTASSKTAVQPAAIEALLQQGTAGTANTADKNQQLLAMLSGGQAVKQAVTVNTVNATVNAAVDATVNTAITAATTVPVAAATTEPMPATASAASKDTQPAAEPQAKSLTGLWGNAVLSVENQNPGNAQQQLSGGNPQDAGQAFQQNQSAPQSQQPVAMTAAQTPQLPEEAQFDIAPAKDTGNTTTAQAAPTLFQQTLQDTSTVQSAASPQVSQPQTNYDIPRQIVDQARLIRSTEDTQMVIKLKPEHLGELTLKVSVTANGSVNASFHTDNAQVRAAIESSMIQLRQELQAQGIRVDNVGVYAGLGDGSLGSSQQQYQQQQGGSVRSQQADLAAFEEDADGLAVPAAEAAASTTGDTGVDYRI